ncbi:MAG TPA: DUF4412 domain-containing protein [Thermodesulfobacteriota bacterium]|nr:DUF4412 domain-containing protein [Thermodesulfobacteriota bacterium]
MRGVLLKSMCVFLFVIASLAFSLEMAFAGFIMEQVSYKKGEAEKRKGRIFISKNRIKFVEEQNGQAVAIFDLNTGEMVQIDNEGKRYIITTPEEYFKFIQDMTDRMKADLEKQLSKLPPDQRAKAEEMMKAQGMKLPGEGTLPKKVSLKKTDESRDIAGYRSNKYEIYEDGKLSEEIWISKDIGLDGELDMKKMASYMSEIKKISEKAGLGYSGLDEQERVLKEIYETGFPTRSVDYLSDGSAYIEEIVRVNKADLSDGEFQPPAGYKRITLQEMIQPGR